MPLTGYVHATTPGNLGLGSGLVEHAPHGGVFSTFGTTRGAPRFTPGEEWRTPEMDGLSTPIAGMDRRVFTEATIEFTLIEMDAAKFAILMPGSSSVTATGVTTITGVAAGVYVGETSLGSWRISWRRGGGTLMQVHFPKGIPVIGGIGAADRAEGDIPVTIRSRLYIAAGRTVDSLPYEIILGAA